MRTFRCGHALAIALATLPAHCHGACCGRLVESSDQVRRAIHARAAPTISSRVPRSGGCVGRVTSSLIRLKMPYAPDDPIPLGPIAVSPSLIVAPPSLPVSNLKELIEYSTKQVGAPFVTAGSGRTPHFVKEMLKEKGAQQIVVPDKSRSESITAVIGDRWSGGGNL
ncbi:tripartite tricarboxylate transporter substrate-binding protein [Cupriavidus sp. RAF12]|uniref:tripartite tricarboxylate transporter substrate-binding protein n=1 Tax=Cupriavidus sp. RAF12 TaxID=3233050 RepID=UPI003F8FEAD3